MYNRCSLWWSPMWQKHNNRFRRVVKCMMAYCMGVFTNVHLLAIICHVRDVQDKKLGVSLMYSGGWTDIYLRLHLQCSWVCRTSLRWCASSQPLCVPAPSSVPRRPSYAATTVGGPDRGLSIPLPENTKLICLVFNFHLPWASSSSQVSWNPSSPSWLWRPPPCACAPQRACGRSRPVWPSSPGDSGHW